MGAIPKPVGRVLASLLAAFVCLPYTSATDTSNPSPTDIVRKAVQNEIACNQRANQHFMFRDEKKTPQSSETKLVVETSDATAGLLVMRNGQALSPQEQRDEDARLATYLQNPQELRKKNKQEREDADHTERILRALPEAFLYERDGTELGREGLGAPGDQLLRLNFRPNPNYNPPSHVEQVLTGMQGHLLIDATQNRIAEIDGTLEKEVGFGWGILGHLNPGGRFLVQQAEVGNRQWEVSHMELSFTGKVLFVKKINIHSNETFSDFHAVPPNLTFAQGVELLKKEAAENHSTGAPVEANQQNGTERAQNQKPVAARNQAEKTLCCDH